MKKAKKLWVKLTAVLSLIVMCVVGVVAYQVASANDAEVNTLKVKTQLKANSDNASKKDIRLLTAIDDYKNYQYVGFEIKVTGTGINKEWNKTEKKAWTSILENGEPVSASTIFGNGANYFVAHSITGIPESAWNATWVVRPYGVTLAGDTVYGTERQFSIQSTVDNRAEGSLNGKITLPVSSTEAPVVTLTNSANTTTYTTTVVDGSYVLNVPQDTYKMTVSHSGFADNYVEAVQVGEKTEQNVAMRKNISSNFETTADGGCQSVGGDHGNFILDGKGTVWKAEVKIPEMNNSQYIGFIVRPSDGTKEIVSQWMRVILCKYESGFRIETHINKDGVFNVAEATTGYFNGAVGKMLQLVLKDGTLTLTLGEEELAVYTNDYVVTQNGNTGTIGDCLNLLGENGQYCGLYSYYAGMKIQDWAFEKKFFLTYRWSYVKPFADEHDNDMTIDGVLDEARWENAAYHEYDAGNGVKTRYATVYTDYGVYIGAEVEEPSLQWNARFNFSRTTANPANSAFHFEIKHRGVTASPKRVFEIYNFYVDMKHSASRNQTHFEARSKVNNATKMTAEFFVSWEALHIDASEWSNVSQSVEIHPRYRHVVAPDSGQNTWYNIYE